MARSTARTRGASSTVSGLDGQPKVVILCGGLGTRIRDVSETLPKPMLPIGDKPVVWHIMKTYAAHGFRDFVLCLGYKGWVIKEFFLNYEVMTRDITVRLGARTSVTIHGAQAAEHWNITLVETGDNTATAGRVAAVRRYVEDGQHFFLTYGDGVADVDITKLFDFHRKRKAVVTVTAVRPPGRFGELDIDDDRVFQFNEKPQASAGFINGGFFVCDAKRVWKYLAGGPDQALEREPMRSLAADGELYAYPHLGFWQPMDTLREFSLLNEMWSAGEAPWKKW